MQGAIPYAGLGTSPPRSDTMVHGHSAKEQESMGKQVDEAEVKGLHTGHVRHSRGYYPIEKGIGMGKG